MDYDKLIEHLKRRGLSNGSALGPHSGLYDDAALAIETLRAENAEMERQLNEFSEFLCHMTGNLLSKTNYTAQAMISAAEDYQQRVCDNDCDLRADLARVTAERDAAISDLTYIARTYPVDLCDDLVCQYCKYYQNVNTGCPGWTENDCFEWRGIEKED